jgi:hypothetical protein
MRVKIEKKNLIEVYESQKNFNKRAKEKTLK